MMKAAWLLLLAQFAAATVRAQSCYDWIDFEGDLPPGVTVTMDGLWHVTSVCVPGGGCIADGSQHAYYGDSGQCNFDVGQTSGSLVIEGLVAPASAPVLAFCSSIEGEDNCWYDLAYLVVNNQYLLDCNFFHNNHPLTGLVEVDLAGFESQALTVVFRFDTVDPTFNVGYGWSIDNVVLASRSDCDLDGVLDVLQIIADPGLDWNGDCALDACATPNYCVANANSTGLPAVIGAEGTPVVLENDLALRTVQVPNDRFGYYLMSMAQDFVPNFGGSSGNLCLASPQVRFNRPPTGEVLDSGSTGEMVFSPDLTNLPQGIVFLAGETWSFQLWFRDAVFGSPTSNTSDGIAILFR